MSKRGPQSSLNHLNWNETDEPEEKGEFTKASDDVLKQRVIKKARRRVATDDADSTAPSASASVFGAFKGFASTPLAKSGADKPVGGGAQSFSFLSTLGAAKTNGNGTATVSSSGAAADGGGGGAAKPTFSFGSNAGTMAASDASKKMFAFGSPTSLKADMEKSKATFAPPKGTSDDAIKKMFSFASSSSSSSQPAASSSTSKTDSEKAKAEKKQSTKPVTEADKQTVIRNNVVALNKAFIAWITEKCRENPYCKLHPVFRDYEKQFDEIQAMSPGKTVEKTAPTTTSQAAAPENKVAPAAAEPAKPKEPEKEMPKPGFFFGGSASAATAAKESPTKPSSGFTFGSSSKPFSFGSLASSTSTNATTTTPSTVSTSSSSFFAGASTFAAKSATGGFTFGGVMSKPPAPDSSAAGGGPDKPAGGDAEADEDEPPKVEFTPVEEKDSVYSKRCKLFVKVGASYSDRGVGTLHIKMVDAKVQVLVRADTSLGNILLNIILNESVPVQRLGKNNVMMICLPTPDAKPPPTSVLLRVKTGEEADELLATLLKYKPK
uniref:RanBD1 domain-containing protein n=1 Tax=Anopheles coluzzii TaxID=1518534 RepID=A0A8W7PB84_ANOCL